MNKFINLGLAIITTLLLASPAILCAFGFSTLRLCEKKPFTQRRKVKPAGRKEFASGLKVEIFFKYDKHLNKSYEMF